MGILDSPSVSPKALDAAIAAALTPLSAPELIGTHPNASVHATARGRQLQTAQVWQGQLYFGYGDTEVGTPGGVKLSSFDPVTRVWTLRGTMNSEEAWRLRIRGTNDVMVIPFADPIGTEGNEYVTINATHVVTAGGPIGTSFNHCFDYGWLSTTVPFILVGQSATTGNPHIVEFRNGAWATAASPPFVQDTRDVNGVATAHTWSRFYDVGVLNDFAYVSMGGGYVSSDFKTTQLDAGFASFVRQTDGTWTQTGPVFGGFFHPQTYKNEHIVYRNSNKQLMSFDGTTITTRWAANECLTHFVHTDYCYVVVDKPLQPEIYRSADLITWEFFGMAPLSTRSIVADTSSGELRVYIGTADSKVFSCRGKTSFASQVVLDSEIAARISVDGTKVSKTGDTMTGPLVMGTGSTFDISVLDIRTIAGVLSSRWQPVGTGMCFYSANSSAKIRWDNVGVGLNGNVPVAKAAAITQPAGGRVSVKTAIDAILASLGNIGITNAPIPANLTELYTDADIAPANKDGLAATPSLRTLGVGALQAASGTDKRFNPIVPPVTWWIGAPGIPSTMPLPPGSNGNIYLLSVILRESITIDQLSLNTQAAGPVGSTATLLAYGDSGVFWPGALLREAG